MKQNLTIVILTYNSSHIVGSCLEHLNFEKYKVVVVDNASKDKTVEFVRKNFPQAQVIELKKNIGYGRGNNVALSQVETEFALVLNPDAIILEKDIEIVLEEMKKNKLAAMAGPVVLEKYPLDYAEKENKIIEIKQELASAQKDYYEQVGENFTARILVGAALFMKVSIMQKIGYFDEKIFLYYEDEELCYRVKMSGYQNIVVPAAVAFHVGGKSSGSSLKVTYKKSWHLTWSKLFWKKMRKGKLAAKRSAIKLAVVYLVKALVSLLGFNAEKIVLNLGAAAGAFAFFIGLESFKENGDSRG